MFYFIVPYKSKVCHTYKFLRWENSGISKTFHYINTVAFIWRLTFTVNIIGAVASNIFTITKLENSSLNETSTSLPLFLGF